MVKYFYNFILSFATLIIIKADNSSMDEQFSVYPVYNETF